MTRSDFTADLPAPRDDEPASLRDDIADELRDHLECALRREELKSDSEPWGSAPRSEGCGRSPDRATSGGVQPRRSPAYQRVLERFGDPRAVARKLWFDAMREKIMGQRISIMLQAIMAGAVIAMCIIVWRTTEQNSAAQATLIATLNQTQNELLQSQREANAQFAEQLAALAAQAPQPADAAPSEWNTLKVKCVYDTPDGPPVAGAQVQFTGESERERAVPGDEQTTDANGMIDFGKVLYGHYRLFCHLPNGLYSRSLASVRPGQDKVATIVCPSSPPPIEAVKFDLGAPEHLQQHPVYLVAIVTYATQSIDHHDWTTSSPGLPAYVLTAEGRALGELDADLSEDLRRALQSTSGLTNVDHRPLVKRISHATISPVAERPGYQLHGTLVAFLSQHDNTTGLVEGKLPALKRLTSGTTSSDAFEMNPETHTLVQGREESQAFWREVLEGIKRNSPPFSLPSDAAPSKVDASQKPEAESEPATP